jgi:ribose transport system ATP-binding protein
MAVLRCRSLVKRFPGVLALNHVDLEVRGGKVLVLLGENGAGKSTLMKILSGVYQPDGGQMELDGAPYRPSGPGEAIAAGVGMIHQETNLLPGLSVAENIFLGRLPLRRGVVDYPRLRSAAREQLRRVGLDVDPATPCRRLSVAALQQVEIAKALSLDARLLILDEPTASLGAEEAEVLFGLVEQLRDRGVGFVYISHRLGEVRRIGDSIVVLRDGQRVADWDRADIPESTLIEAMVGRPVDRVWPEPAPVDSDGALLEVEGLGRQGAFRDVTFTLARGEVLGIAGLVGAGRTELARALFGAEPPDAGTVRLLGRPLDLRSPAGAVAAGIVLVPEDRKGQGLVLGLSLQDNIALPSLRNLARGGVVRRADLGRLMGDLTRRLDIRGRPAQAARTLSGGNQQKAVIAKWLPRDPKVVIFDEPTRGVDVGAKAAIYEVIRDLTRHGVGVIVISSELPEVLGISHRVLVLRRGVQTGLLARAEATEQAVMTLAMET